MLFSVFAFSEMRNNVK